MMGPKGKLIMVLKKKSMDKPSMFGPSMDDYDDYDDNMMEDEPGGYEREGMRIAAQDLIDAIRTKDSISVMDALETFVNLCKKD